MGYPAIAYRYGAGLLRRAGPGFQRLPANTSPRLPRPWTPPTYRPTGPAANDNVRKLLRLSGSTRFRWREAYEHIRIAADLLDMFMWVRQPPNASGWTQHCLTGSNMGIHMYAAGGACSTNIRSSTVIFGPDTARRVSGPNIGWYVNRGEQPHPFGPNWAWYGDAWSRVEPFPARQYFIPDHPSRPRYIRYRRQWAEPSWVPAWVPMIVPPLAPQPAPVAPPYREIPRLDPSPDFPEMPQRGNEFAPSPRVPTFPWPADWPAYWGDWFPDVDPPRLS